MYRQSKFRAWDKVQKKFLDPWPEGFHLLGETTCFDTIGQQLAEREPFDKTTLEKLNDVIITQYTGVQINGKDVYEGDIGKFENSNNLYKIEFHSGAFCLCRLNGKVAWTLYTLTQKILSNNFEIIGNIFENLIEGDSES